MKFTFASVINVAIECDIITRNDTISGLPSISLLLVVYPICQWNEVTAKSGNLPTFTYIAD